MACCGSGSNSRMHRKRRAHKRDAVLDAYTPSWFERQKRKWWSSSKPPNPIIQQRLSTVVNDNLINFIELPLVLQVGADGREMTISTAKQFMHYMGFVVDSEIARGGFGRVLKVTKTVVHPDTGQATRYIMACKVVKLRQSKERSFESLRSELYIFQTITPSCPYLIRYYEHYVLKHPQDPDYLMAHIFMEFADAGTLFQEVVKSPRSPLPHARQYFYEIATGLAFLHRHQLAHLDVKLENVLMVSLPRQSTHSKTNVPVKQCKLTDFGLSKFAYKEGVGVLLQEKFRGTRSYMAPEVLRCKYSHSKSYHPFLADVWALGVCLFVMLARAFPYPSPVGSERHIETMVHELLDGVYLEEDRWREEFDSGPAEILVGTMQPSPRYRWTIERVLRHRWVRQGNEESRASRKESPVSNRESKVSRKKAK